jgi:hypothetical protein
MTEMLFEQKELVILASVKSEEDLKPRPGINLNPPPVDGRCECCGRHISELKPFGKSGDPLVGDFDGDYLVRRWRPDGPYDEESEFAWEEAERCYKQEGFKHPWEWVERKYGKKRGQEMCFNVQLHGSIRKSWECRECAVLNEEEYFEKLWRARRVRK